jgi:hypothetical protein
VLEPDGDPVITQEATFKWLCGTLPFQISIGSDNNIYTFGKVTDPTNVDQTNEQLAGTSSSTSTYSPDNGFTTGIVPSCTVNFSQTTNPSNPWNPAANNISASIWTRTGEGGGSSTGVWTSTFPDEGDVPYIIAVDQDQEWTEERQIISEKIPSFNTTGWLPE